MKKALQWTWFLELDYKEIELYEHLGINYFYLGELETANFYHERFILGDIEVKDSPNRNMSNNDIKVYIKKC